MPDHNDEVSEVERLAGGINASIESIGETIGCVLQGSWWLVVGCLGFSVAFVAVATPFTMLEQRIGFIPAVLVFGLATWLAVHLYLRYKGGGSGTST
jgi:hypothetical protein